MGIAIYRSGQGVWPRGIAAASLAAVALFGTAELSGALSRVPVLNRPLAAVTVPFVEYRWEATWSFFICLAVLAACGAGIWVLMNHQRTVDFLIETGEEMRKVSWPWDASAQGTCWGILPNKGRELFNNSAVVIVGVFVMAGFLYAFDVVLQGALYWFVRAG